MYCRTDHGTHFTRAISNGMHPRFLVSHKGIGYFRDAVRRVEQRLPEHERPGNGGGRDATNHTARRTAASIAMNAEGADSLVVSKMTHHKDINQLTKYVDPKQAMLMSTALAIADATHLSTSSNDASSKQDSESRDGTTNEASSASASSSSSSSSSSSNEGGGVASRTRSSPSPKKADRRLDSPDEPPSKRHEVHASGGNVYKFYFN